MTEAQRRTRAREYAGLARSFHESGNDTLARNFADAAEAGGLRLDRSTYEEVRTYEL